MQVGVLHGAVGPCGSDIFPDIFTRLDDQEILDFVDTIAFNKSTKGKLHHTTNGPHHLVPFSGT